MHLMRCAVGVCPGHSDARLFCKNQQVDLKTKPKIGNLPEKQAQHTSSKKIQQNRKSAGKLNGKAGRHIRKKTQDQQIFTKTPQNHH